MWVLVKGLAFICAIGLGILWLIGLGNPSAPGWMTWLNGVAAILSLMIIGALRKETPSPSTIVNTLMLSFGLFVLWILGVAGQAMPWQSWWTFVFACGMGIVGLACAAQRSKSRAKLATGNTETEERKKLRRVG